MNVNIIKVLAYGCYRRFMWLEAPNGRTICVRIDNELYTWLKTHGVPTSQSMRKRNDV